MIKANSDILFIILLIVIPSVLGLGGYLHSGSTLVLKFGVLTGLISAILSLVHLKHIDQLYVEKGIDKISVSKETILNSRNKKKISESLLLLSFGLLFGLLFWYSNLHPAAGFVCGGIIAGTLHFTLYLRRVRKESSSPHENPALTFIPFILIFIGILSYVFLAYIYKDHNLHTTIARQISLVVGSILIYLHFVSLKYKKEISEYISDNVQQVNTQD